MKRLAVLVCAVLPFSVSAEGAELHVEALTIFKTQCTGALDNFAAVLTKATADGWISAGSDSGPITEALKANYIDTQKYKSIHVLLKPKFKDRYVLAYIEGSAQTKGERTVPAMNICRLVDLQASKPLDGDQFEAEFDPLASPQYQAFVTLRQVYFASPDAPPIPAYPMIAGRPKTDAGLAGWVLTASRFAN
jgi:hypothetical protein